MRTWAIAALVLGAVGCAPVAELQIDLLTDYVPGREFDAVVVSVSSEGDDAVTSIRHEVGSDDRFLPERTRLAGGWVVPGRTTIEVRLERGRRIVMGLRSVLRVGGSAVVPFALLHGCDSVGCPGPGDPATATECDGGRCMAPDCVETGGCPGPACSTATDCTPGASCTEVDCVAGRCVLVPIAGACTGEAYCDPLTGCRTTPPPDPFAFVDVSGASPGARYVSSVVVLGGTDTWTATVSGEPTAELLVDDVVVGRGATVTGGARVALRMNASFVSGAATTSMLEVGGRTATWTVTTGTGTCAGGTVIEYADAGVLRTLTVPDGCFHLEAELFGGGGAGGSGGVAGCLDGEGGEPTLIRRASGEVLAVAGGGGSGLDGFTGATGAYVRSTLSVVPGEMLELVVADRARENFLAGGSAATGLHAGAVRSPGTGLGDVVAVGYASIESTAFLGAPTNELGGNWGYGAAPGCGRPDGGGPGHAVLVWAR